MNHTKEPWRTTELDRVISDTMEKLNDDYFIADCFGPDAKENARRIVACVNACAGSSTDWLRGYGYMLNAADCAKPFQQNIRDLAAQRDELLAALHEHETFYQNGILNSPPGEINRLSVLRKSLIAKCEAQS